MKNILFTAICTVTVMSANVSQALTFDAFKDANIHNNSTDPIGTTNILAPFTSSSYSIYSYIGFDISTFNNLNTTASASSLDLYGFGNITDLELSIYGLNDNILDNWAEDTIDWLNAPGKSGDVIDAASTTLLYSDTVSYAGNSVISFDTTALLDFINADTDGLVSFILTQPVQTSTNHAFSSKESFGNPSTGSAGNFTPQLNITPVPVPAAFWLLASGLAGLVLQRRRKP